MFLTVIWVLMAAVLGFVLGRVSMYGREPRKGHVREDDWERENVAREDVVRERTADIADAGNRQEETGELLRNPAQTGLKGRYDYDKWRLEHRGYEKCGKKTWSVGSPVSGIVTTCREGTQPLLVIRPSEDKLYAPVGGKIIRLYPLGNAFSFTTEFGTEMHIQVGESKDELMGCHYRPRVIQNEVVNKGKLLLEFDREALEAQGENADVAVRVENSIPGGSVRMTAGEYVKSGEEIFEVSEQMVTKART